MEKERIASEEDVICAVKAYLENIEFVIKKYGDPTAMSTEQKEDLIYELAEYPQQLRNLERKFGWRVSF